MDYPKTIKGVRLHPVTGKFSNGSDGNPISRCPSEWGNAITDEILQVILSAKLTPSENDSTQLLTAMNKLFLGVNSMAANSGMLEGYSASDFASSADIYRAFQNIDSINAELSKKLAITAQAADSLKLGGVQASSYVQYSALKDYATVTALNSKLNATDQASDSAKLAGRPGSDYVQTSALSSYATVSALNAKLDATATAGDSAKLGGSPASAYALVSALSGYATLQSVANKLDVKFLVKELHEAGFKPVRVENDDPNFPDIEWHEEYLDYFMAGKGNLKTLEESGLFELYYFQVISQIPIVKPYVEGVKRYLRAPNKEVARNVTLASYDRDEADVIIRIGNYYF